jgi:hypothetical protein
LLIDELKFAENKEDAMCNLEDIIVQLQENYEFDVKDLPDADHIREEFETVDFDEIERVDLKSVENAWSFLKQLSELSDVLLSMPVEEMMEDIVLRILVRNLKSII